MLMGWKGASSGVGNVSAGTGLYFFIAAILLYAGNIGEWVLGNKFPSLVFFTFGSFWGAFGATLTPWFNVIGAYEGSAGFYDSFAFLLLFMGVLHFLYTIAALRTDICLVAILVCFTFTFPLLTASYFLAADGNVATSDACRIAGAAFAFIAGMIAWYLWFSMILKSVDFPIGLPVGNLSRYIKGASEKLKAQATTVWMKPPFWNGVIY